MGKTSIPVRATKKTVAVQRFSSTKPSTRSQTRSKPGHMHSTLYAAFCATQKANNMFHPYIKAELCSSNPNDWYIYYYYQNPDTGKMERFRERFNMNRIHDLKERKSFALEAIAFINEQLDKGFNPFTDAKKAMPGIIISLDQIVGQLCQKASASTQSTYKLMKNRFADFIVEHDMKQMTMQQVSTITVERFRAWMRRKGLSAKSINDNVAHLGLFWDAEPDIEVNPWRKLKPVRQSATRAEDDKYEPLTRVEMQAIFKYLNGGHRSFARLALMIYYSWGRTIELLRLKVGDIDLQENVIYFHSGGTKNNKSARVQIVAPLREILLEMKLDEYPPHYYLFSNRWLPGESPKRTNEASERWRELVKEKLEIKKSMYALKHTGNIDYLLQNKGKIDLKWQQMQNRHSSSAMTERYCRQLGAYFVDTDQLIFTGFEL